MTFRSKLVLASVAIFATVLAIGVAQASNMGFKMNMIIQPLGTPAPKGQNFIALPYKNPYVTAVDVCTALGLSAATGKVTQIKAGPAPAATLSFNCGDLPGSAFTLLPRVGLVVNNSTAAGGIVVGSHASNPPGNVTLYPLGGFPLGQNRFPVPYHTTDITANDLCIDLGLPTASGKIVRTNASTGAQPSFNCSDLPGSAFNLVLGESVIVTFSGASPITVAAGHPAHF